MFDLYLCKYNNYFNRIRKGGSALSTYTSNSSKYMLVENVNFNIRDGVNTHATINFTTAPQFTPDYLVVTSHGNTTILHRWFIMENEWKNEKQCFIQLYRDVKYDLYDYYKSEPAYIEKGCLSKADSFIYKAEDCSFNQVLKSQTDIKLADGACIIGYIDKKLRANAGNNYESTDTTIPLLKITDFSSQLSVLSRASANSYYDIFVIPYETPKVTISGNTYSYTKDKALEAAQILAIHFGTNLYDLQLFPFNPCIGNGWSYHSSNGVVGGTVSPGVDYSMITILNGTYTNIPIIWSSSDSISKSLGFLLPYNPETITNVEKKYYNLASFIRIVDPVSGSTFEFNPIKFGSLVNQVTLYIRATLKPYQPYLHIYPDFGGLYGSWNFATRKEDRGLFSKGDYSLPIMSNAWQQYMINNKTYQQSFDRGIENMEVTQNAQKVQQLTGIAGSALSTGLKVGLLNPVAGVIAGIGSAAAGAADYAVSEKLRAEQIDYARDQFAMNCENIQAMPNTLSRVSTFDIDSKLYPHIDYYEATSAEKTAFEDKIRYNGMTVGRIGTFADFESRANNNCRYIKGKLIRMSSLYDDAHIFNILQNELNLGYFHS